MPAVSLANPGSLVSWTQTTRFADVTITTALGSSYLNGLPGQGTVYLTTRIGAGATSADEIARTTLTGVAQNGALEMLFTHLTLPANTYYVVAASDTGGGGLGWVIGALTTTFAPGVTIDPSEVTMSLAAYSPASAFFAPTPEPTSLFYFSVTGDPLSVAPVPEPASLVILLAGLGGLTLLRPAFRRTR